MKRKRQIIVILLLLIAVLAASFGIYAIRKANKAADSVRANEAAAEQQTEEVSDEPEGRDDTSPLATLFFASDYQEEPGMSPPPVNLEEILKAAKADDKAVEKIIMCGDYTNDRNLHDYQLSPDESIYEIRSIAASVFPEMREDDMLFVQGNHDRMTDNIAASGLHEFDDYLIYVLNTEEDFPWKQGKTAGCLAKVRKSSAEMKECFDSLIEKGETRPVFIAGHVPLHFTARTSSRHSTGDNLYSSLVFNVVNEAAESLDIVYLFGHNHSKGWDCYVGGSSVYKATGDPILIPRFSDEKVNTDEYSEETLNFTYLNAGYTGYYMNCGPEEYDSGKKDQYSAADETLTGTIIEIYSDHIDITRYDAGGIHELGHQGEADPYKGGIDASLIDAGSYSTKTTSPQTIYFRNKLDTLRKAREQQMQEAA